MPLQRERGETLTGLLVGLSVGLVVLAAGSAMLAHHLRGHRMALQDSHLHHDLRSAMDWMARELRKAQYSAKAWETRSPSACDDAFCEGLEDFSIEKDWIDFSYDRNHNGSKDNDECMGFRVIDQRLMVKRSCVTNGAWKSTGDWQAVTDQASLEITALSWQLHCELRQGWLHRSVLMTLTAQWSGDASRQLSLSQTVHLRNDLPVHMQTMYCP
jgi:type II secretory pathway component PulJ